MFQGRIPAECNKLNEHFIYHCFFSSVKQVNKQTYKQGYYNNIVVIFQPFDKLKV